MQKSELRVALLIVASALCLAACRTLNPPNDKAITVGVQAKLFADSVLKTRDIQVTSQEGVVTLTGSVGTELEKAAAERLAGEVDGVKSVANQLTVAPTPQSAMPSAKTAAPIASTARPPAPAKQPRHRERASTPPPPEAATPESAPSAMPPPTASAPAPSTAAAAPAAPAAAPAPPPASRPEQITIPAGSVLTVRMIDSINSTRNHAGDEFGATVEAPVVIGDRVVIPRGADARVRLVQAASAGTMTGQSELEVELVSLTVGSTTYTVESSVIQKQGASRGKRTAEAVGGGSALGALIGAIAGRGKGAAIGAAVGAGAGATVQASTRGEQVNVPSETKLDFTLNAPLTVTM
jgi:hypothetical protein